MKNTAIKLLLIMIFGAISPLFATAFVSMTNPLITPAPLDPIEINGEGVATFRLQETFGGIAPASDTFGEANIRISVELNKLDLKNQDTSLITGALMDYFDVTYSASAKRITFTQIADYPALMEARVDIPVTVSANSASTDVSLNGFNANISANDNDTVADGSASSFTYTVTAAPTAPSILNIDEKNVNESMPTAVLTNNSRPSISGICIAGNIVSVQIDGYDIEPTTTCASNGTFDIIPNADIEEGEHEVTARQTDSSTDLTSNFSTLDYLMIDTISPDEFLTIDRVDGKQGASITTIDRTPEISGECEANLLVTIQIDGNDMEPTVMCSTNGTYSVSANEELEIGTHNVASTQIDKAGNVATTNAVELVITYPPVIAPEVQIIDGINVNESMPTTVLTNDSTPNISGICIAGNKVDVQIDGIDIQPTVQCASNGTFSIVPDVNIEDGEHRVTTRQTDPHTGVVSDLSSADNLIVDTAIPTPHTISTIDGKDNNNIITSNNKPEITGECETGTTVIAFIDGVQITPTVECAEGKYSIIPDVELEDGSHNITTKDIDDAGNISTVTPVSLTVNTVLPNYKPTLTAQGTIVTGAQGNFSILVRIADFAGGISTGPVKFSIVKNNNLSINFDQGKTEQQNSSVQNSSWALEETTSLYIFTYKGSFTPSSSSKVGLSGTFTSPINTKGAFALDVTVLGGSGEDDFTNNKDTEIIEYNNLVQE